MYAFFRKSLYFFICLLMLLSCGDDHGVEAEEMIHIYDRGVMSEFEEQLTSNGIEFRKEANGSILYKYKDKGIVSNIESNLLKETLLNKYSTSYGSKEDERLFIAELQNAGVIFWNRELMGKNWIFWNDKDDKRVKDIKERLYRTRLEQSKID